MAQVLQSQGERGGAGAGLENQRFRITIELSRNAQVACALCGNLLDPGHCTPFGPVAASSKWHVASGIKHLVSYIKSDGISTISIVKDTTEKTEKKQRILISFRFDLMLCQHALKNLFKVRQFTVTLTFS